MASPRPERDPSDPSTSSAWRRASSARIRERCGSTRTRGCSARPGRRPTSACTARTTSGGSCGSATSPRSAASTSPAIRILFELEERLGARILEALYAEGTGDMRATRAAESKRPPRLATRHRRSIDGRPLTDRTVDRRSTGRPTPPIRTRHIRRTRSMAKRPSTPVEEPSPSRRPRPDRASCPSSHSARRSSSRR